MAISIGNVWDSTTDVLAGRGAMLATVAGFAFFLPGAVQAAVTSYGGTSPGIAAVGAIVAIAALIVLIWGQLTVIGIAADPAATRSAAGATARRRLGSALLVSLVLVGLVLAAVLPIVVVLAATGFDFKTAAAGTGGAAPSPGAGLFCFLYTLVLLGAGLWLSARLFVLNPVIRHERRGIGAIARSMALTRGLTLKLIATNLLLTVVWAVAAYAAQAVVFLIARLLLGPAQIATATFLGALASGAVTAAFVTVLAAFTARLYAALVPVSPR